MRGKGIFSSESDEWSTPQNLFDQFNNEFDFNLDPCASESNHKCAIWYSQEEDGLSQDWGGWRVWCNPPYSNVYDWVAKAFYETRNDGTVVVMLLPSRTDTRYFHDFIYGRAEIRFLRGRVRFNDSKVNAPFPSMIVIFRGAKV